MLATQGVVSILLLLAIITLVFLITEAVLRIRNCGNKTRNNIRILILSIFTSILAGEVILRISGKYDSYREQKGDFFYNFIYETVRLDNETLFEIFDDNYKATKPHDTEFERKSNDEFRILGLGDSFTEGVGTSPDSTWLKLLEKKLREKNANQTIKTFNAGLSGNDPFFEYLLLKEKLLVYKPDLVIVAMNNSDIIETIARGGMERFQPDSTIIFKKGPWFETLFGMSYLCRLFVFEVLQYDWLFLSESERKGEEIEALNKIYACMLKFGILAKAEDLEILLIFHPMIEEVVSGNFLFKKMINKLSNEASLETLDLLDFFQNETIMNKNNASSYYWEIDKHHNSKGYELFAAGVEKKITKMFEQDLTRQSN